MEKFDRRNTYQYKLRESKFDELKKLGSMLPVKLNPYVYAVMVQPFPKNVVLQYAHSGAPLAPNMQPGGHFSQDGTPAAQTLNPNLMYHMFPQFMPQPMPDQNVVQPPPRVATQRVPGINQPRPAEYQLLKEQIRAIEGFSILGLNARELCLSLNVFLPQKFKVLDQPKYKGLSCPRSKITMKCRKMDSYIDNCWF
ncbi:hypothetical protein KIW84_065037 [Lathyrus oleraceus]|uniref:Uncharacterized protein n=1 Tax=Pisum sativum TaxID=3888 RepID=A0A9D5A9U6_PEA|nr:hypothetical protein KIW84_065037 [Pisum sativum]